jgi:hypothetical protein
VILGHDVVQLRYREQAFLYRLRTAHRRHPEASIMTTTSTFGRAESAANFNSLLTQFSQQFDQEPN